METVVLVDSGYYNYYRFFATFSWHKIKSEIPLKKEECINDPDFMKSFEKMWFDTIRQIAQKFYVQRNHIIFARDGRKVWRYQKYPEYKGTRDNSAIYPIFDHINKHFFPKIKEEGINIIQIPEAEADDIISIAAEYIHNVFPKTKIIVISGDHDLFQIPNVEFYELKGWKKTIPNNIQKGMMLKILAGDKSDNIPSIFKGCGKKTAENLTRESQENLEKILKEKGGYDQYKLNQQLIDFNFIPLDIIKRVELILDNLLFF